MMGEKLIDAKGMLCPRPLILTKKALVEMPLNDSCEILIDNQTSRENVERYLHDHGMKCTTTVQDGVFHLQVKKTTQLASVVAQIPMEQEGVAKTPGRGAHVLVLTSDKMGRGPEDLGGILLQAFINTVKEVSPLPSAIVCYSSGVLLAVEGHPCLPGLRELQEKGVKILVCGTCVNYYEAKEQVQVGEISNMLSIMETMTNASHVVNP